MFGRNTGKLLKGPTMGAHTIYCPNFQNIILFQTFTGRNEVVAKVMFLLVSVRGVSGRENPPAGRPPGRETPLARRPPARRPPPPAGNPPARRTPCSGRTPPVKRPPQQGDPPAGRPPSRKNPQQGDPLARRPPQQVGRENPPQGDPPVGRTPLLVGRPPSKETPLQGDPRQGEPPSRETPIIRSMSGRYASYWNAFLLVIYWQKKIKYFCQKYLLHVVCIHLNENKTNLL